MNFDTLQNYVILMRYKRSGSALLTQLLDAHPNCIFVRREELYASLDKWETPEKVYQHLYGWSIRRKGRALSVNGYKYPIEGVGFAHDPISIGHKSSTRRYLPIAESRSKLIEFHKAVGYDLRLKFLHLVRSPYDQVNARWQQKEFRRNNSPLDKIIAHVREQTEANWKMFGHCDYTEYHQVHYEDLQTQPLCTMTKVCDFLSLPLLEEHLENCRNLVYQRAEKTAATWTADTREQVKHIIEDYPEFYRRYSNGT
jgi:hypothetical protein